MALHPPVQLVCMGNRTSRRAASYEVTDNTIQIVSYKTTTTSVLTNGEVTFMAHENSSTPSFQEGSTYIIKDYYVYVKNGYECVSTTMRYRCAPLVIAEAAAAVRMAKNILNPPSQDMTGDEADIFTRGSYVTLKGYIEELSSYRMIHCKDGDVPIRDVTLRCGARFIEVSLWQDEDLADIHMGAHIVVTHLRATVKRNRKAKFNSSRFSSVEVPEHPNTREWLTIIGISENEDDLVLLADDYMVYSMSADLFPGTMLDLLEKLPLNVQVDQANYKIYSIQYLDTVKQ